MTKGNVFMFKRFSITTAIIDIRYDNLQKLTININTIYISHILLTNLQNLMRNLNVFN